MTIPEIPALSRTSPTFRADLDALFLTQIPATIPAFNDEMERVNQFAFGSYSATSSTSLTVGTGSKSLTVEAGKGFTLGQLVLIASSSAPSTYMNGQVVAYDSTTGAMTVNVTAISGGGTSASWSVSVSAAVLVSAAKISQRTITGTDTLTASDFGKLVNLNGTFTLTPDAAATLGAGWWCYVRNTGTGTITLDPNGAETVDGVTSGPVRGTILLICDGTGFTVVKLGPMTTTEVLTSGTSWTAPLGTRTVGVQVQGCGAGVLNLSGEPAGGGGGYCEGVYAVSPGTACTYAIGAATTGTGGSTNITIGGATLTANSGSGLNGGSSSGGQINIPGGPAAKNMAGSISKGGDSMLGMARSGDSSAQFSGGSASGYGYGAIKWTSAGSSADQNGGPACIILRY